MGRDFIANFPPLCKEIFTCSDVKFSVRNRRTSSGKKILFGFLPIFWLKGSRGLGFKDPRKQRENQILKDPELDFHFGLTIARLMIDPAMAGLIFGSFLVLGPLWRFWFFGR